MSPDQHETDDWVERVAATLREADDPAGEARVMARVRAEGNAAEPRRRGVGARAGGPAWWRWLLEPRVIRLRPLAGITAAGVAVVAAALLLSHDRTSPQVSVLSAPGSSAQFTGGPAPTGRPGLATAGESRPVQFVCLAAGARRVSVVGDFNDWRPDSAPLERAGDEGIWAAVVWLPPGVYKYSFLVDGEFRAANDGRPGLPPDDFGGHNSVVIVGSEAI